MKAEIMSFIDKTRQHAERRALPIRNREIWIMTQCVLLKETIMLLLRDCRKYGAISAAMWAGDVTGITKGIRSPYALCRLVDDRVDGDRQFPPGADPVEWLQTLQQHIQLLQKAHDSWDQFVIVRDDMATEDVLLAETLFTVGSRGDKPEVMECLTRYLTSAIHDYQRRVGKTVLPEAALADAYRQSFDPVQDLAFISLRSKVRSRDLPELSELQGRAYAVRDLPKEFPRGEINIPAEVLSETGLDLEELPGGDLWSVPQIREWGRREIDFSEKTAAAIASAMPMDGGEKWIRRILIPPILKIVASMKGILS